MREEAMNFEQDDGRVREVVEARKRARAVAARSWAPVQAVILAGAILWLVVSEFPPVREPASPVIGTVD
jgi:hypothetical protein